MEVFHGVLLESRMSLSWWCQESRRWFTGISKNQPSDRVVAFVKRQPTHIARWRLVYIYYNHHRMLFRLANA